MVVPEIGITEILQLVNTIGLGGLFAFEYLKRAPAREKEQSDCLKEIAKQHNMAMSALGEEHKETISRLEESHKTYCNEQRTHFKELLQYITKEYLGELDRIEERMKQVMESNKK